MYFENSKHLMVGFVIAFVIAVGYFLFFHSSGMTGAVFGFFYFLVTPFLAVFHFPMALAIMMIFVLLFRRVSSCMRVHLRWIAYGLLWLHWVAFGMYCASYVVI